MGAVPKVRISKSRKNKRRTHDALKPADLVTCPQCHSPRLPHHVCPSCGTYRGLQYLDVGEETVE